MNKTGFLLLVWLVLVPGDGDGLFAQDVSPGARGGSPASSNNAPVAPVEPEVVTRDDQGRMTIRAVRIDALDLDGRLDESVYRTTKAISDLIQAVPDPHQPATQRTEAWIFFDDRSVYVSARCWDSAPESDWIANEMRRDSNGITNNDSFGVLFDTFYDRRNGVMFFANPLGAMRDVQITNEGNSNVDWNAVWNVRTGRFAGGWTMEIQIPFKSLRYRQEAAAVWGVQLRRGIRRRNEYDVLTPLPPGNGPGAWTRLSLAATLVGIEVPPPSMKLEIKPYGLSGITTDRTLSPAAGNDVDGELGADVKYGITPNVTLDLTYNTDFAQVEVDEQQINLTRFSLLFPEKREFFLEGRGIFEFGRGNTSSGTVSVVAGTVPELFFTRQIGLDTGRVVPIIGGARLIGRLGATTVGALSIQTGEDAASDTPTTNFTVLRLKHDILRRSSVGAMFTGRSASLRAPGQANQAYGIDGSFSFFENLNFNTYFARSETPGLNGPPESYQARLDYDADRYGLEVSHLFVGEAFNPEIGVVPRPDMRRSFAAARFSPRPRSMPAVQRFTYEGNLEYIENGAGLLESRAESGRFAAELANSDSVALSVRRSYEHLDTPFRPVNGVTIPAGDYQFSRADAGYTIGPRRRVSGSIVVSAGGFYDGTQTTLAFNSGRVELSPQFSVEPSASISWFDLPRGSLAAKVIRSRMTYTFTPRMFVSGIVQYNSSTNSVGTNLRFRWEYIPGSELFLVYTDDRNAELPSGRASRLLSRGFVVKINRLLRF